MNQTNESANQPTSQAIKADRQTFRLHAFRPLLSYFANMVRFSHLYYPNVENVVLFDLPTISNQEAKIDFCFKML